MFKFAAVFAIVFVVAYADEECKCWTNYKPGPVVDGKQQCESTLTLAKLPCNKPEPPKCQCDPETVTGILTDSEGTHCSQSSEGKLIKKWPCENTEDWAKFKAADAEFDAKHK